MPIAFPGESGDYRAARDRLLQREIELRRVTEEVAAERRELPPGGVVPEDYVFRGLGPDGSTEVDVRLSELFAPGRDSLAIYNFMFPRAPDEDLPCPSCTQFLDAFDGVAEHMSQRSNVAVVAKASLPRILSHAESRGWWRMRLLSSGGNAYNRDYFGETDTDAGLQQLPMLNVFRRDGDTIRHFWASELLFGPSDPGQDPRHSDTIDPLWNMFDFLPEGRGSDWYPALSY
jgi:predicted dithiol-disulfide oxidoreductase (DUF899 family)